MRERNQSWTFARVQFQPIQESEMNGERFGYVVTYRQVDIENAEEQSHTVYGVEQSELIIADQEPFRQYEVYVQSVNEVGLSYITPERVIVHSGQDRKCVTKLLMSACL